PSHAPGVPAITEAVPVVESYHGEM
ncbi:hypothetical protein SAMN05443507_11944, partial [Alicyclobacillus tolerans]